MFNWIDYRRKQYRGSSVSNFFLFIFNPIIIIIYLFTLRPKGHARLPLRKGREGKWLFREWSGRFPLLHWHSISLSSQKVLAIVIIRIPLRVITGNYISSVLARWLVNFYFMHALHPSAQNPSVILIPDSSVISLAACSSGRLLQDKGGFALRCPIGERRISQRLWEWNPSSTSFVPLRNPKVLYCITISFLIGRRSWSFLQAMRQPIAVCFP